MGYIGYLLARKTEHEGMITGKVGMKNKFFDYSQLNEGSAKVQQRRVTQDPLNPLSFSGRRTPRQCIRQNSAKIEQMLGDAVLNADNADAIQEELFEDWGNTDLNADAHDELDAMMNDLSSSDGDGK